MTDGEIAQASTITIVDTATDTDGEIIKVQIFIDDVMVSEQPKYNWKNATTGNQTIYAKAFDNYGVSTILEALYFTIITTKIRLINNEKNR